jgi:hydroxyacylglutathione hydrolase
MSVNIKTFVVGKAKTNCYVLWDGNEVVVIDPGGEGPKIFNFIKSKISKPDVTILLTHGHADHIAALPFLLSKYPLANFYAGRPDNVFLYDSNANLSVHLGINITMAEHMSNLRNVTSGDEVTVGNMHFRVMETPGHTPGSLIYILDEYELVFCGDTIMNGTVGPTCFPFGDPQKLCTSIQERILVLPKSFQLLPGHGEPTTVMKEAETNPYVLTLGRKDDEDI